MFEHRLRDYLTADVAVATLTAPTPAAFVPCPGAMFVTPAQQAFVSEVYRMARELAEAQVRKAARPFPPAFSLN